jgi:hypothetical protein
MNLTGQRRAPRQHLDSSKRLRADQADEIPVNLCNLNSAIVNMTRRVSLRPAKR